MTNQKRRSEVQEDVARLYLRLNGFFTTGFIPHSPVRGKVLTEVDALGLRMPFSSEVEREIVADPVLGISPGITDFVIAEVKSHGKQIQFNSALTSSEQACRSILCWSGLFSKEKIDAAVAALYEHLQSDLPKECPLTIETPEHVRIRCLLFSLETLTRRSNQAFFLTGPEVFGYVHACLRPAVERTDCATIYDYNQWREFADIVRYFKRCDASDPPCIAGLYASLGIARQ